MIIIKYWNWGFRTLDIFYIEKQQVVLMVDKNWKSCFRTLVRTLSLQKKMKCIKNLRKIKNFDIKWKYVILIQKTVKNFCKFFYRELKS